MNGKQTRSDAHFWGSTANIMEGGECRDFSTADLCHRSASKLEKGSRPMSIMLLRLAGAIELALICVEGLVPGSDVILPLGGNHLSQVGVVFGFSFVLTELADVTAHAIRQMRDWLKGPRD